MEALAVRGIAWSGVGVTRPRDERRLIPFSPTLVRTMRQARFMREVGARRE